jgi:hypothetical protein
MFSKKVSIWFTLLFLILMLLSLFVYWMRSRQETYADEIITNSAQRFDKSLLSFLDVVKKSQTQLEQTAARHTFSQLSPDSINIYFSRMISNDRFLKGVVLFSEQLNYVLVRDGQTWATTRNSNKNDSLINWQRLDNKLGVVSQWSDTYSYFLSTENYQFIKDELKHSVGSNLWISVQSKMPPYHDLLMTVFDLKGIYNQHVAVAFLYSVEEMGRQFISVLKYKNPLISIITASNGVITPIKTTDTTRIKLYFELNGEVKKLINTWEARSDRQNYSYSFAWNQQVYWSRLIHMDEMLGIRGFAVTVSASDLAKTENNQVLLYVYLAALFFILGLLSFFTIKRKHREQFVTNPEPPEPYHQEELLPLIKKGESEKVEFKSSLRWDCREKVVNKILEDIILKSISAFANAKGGTLFIGVDDHMEIIGIEHDFKTLKKQDVDYFELHLRKLISNQFGLTFSNHFLHIQFPGLESKIICVIRIHPGVRPLFIKTKTKQGTEVEKFYVRSGNASQEVASLQEMNDYINRRFPGK